MEQNDQGVDFPWCEATFVIEIIPDRQHPGAVSAVSGSLRN
jgi:hypothetical protein